jgi:hypothetical protein
MVHRPRPPSCNAEGDVVFSSMSSPCRRDFVSASEHEATGIFGQYNGWGQAGALGSNSSVASRQNKVPALSTCSCPLRLRPLSYSGMAKVFVISSTPQQPLRLRIFLLTTVRCGGQLGRQYEGSSSTSEIATLKVPGVLTRGLR